MSIKAIMSAPGIPKRSYRSGHNFHCFKCNLWVRWLGDNELCWHCMKNNGLKETLRTIGTEEAVGIKE